MTRISRGAARRYDANLVAPRRVMNDVTRRDPELLDDLTADLTRTVLRERGPRVAASALKDLVENVFASASFYAGWTAWTLRGQDPEEFLTLTGAPFTFGRLLVHGYVLAQVAVALGAVGVVYALVLAAFALRSGNRVVRWWGRTERWLVAAPVAAYVVANAAVFAALNLDLTRYMLLAHAAFLLLVYRLALAWVLAPGAPRPARPGADTSI